MADTIAERVAAGAAFLDETEMVWWRLIDLATLDLRSPCRCVLGQLFADSAEYEGCDDGFDYALCHLNGLDDEEMGFDVRPGEAGAERAEYDALTAEWRKVIEARRAASDG